MLIITNSEEQHWIEIEIV